MGTVNQKKKPNEALMKKAAQDAKSGHDNFHGSRNWFASSPITTLAMAASSMFFGEDQYWRAGSSGNAGVDKYLHIRIKIGDVVKTLGNSPFDKWRGLNSAQIMENAIDDALEFDHVATLFFAVELRQKHHMRLTPQVILVRAAHHEKVRGTGIIGRVADGILQRMDDVTNGLAYQLNTYVDAEGKTLPIPNALKKVWRARLESAKPYELAKYTSRNKGVTLQDVIKLTHPNSKAINAFMKGEIKLEGDNETWESMVSREGSTKETWTKAFGVMGHMALLRNMRNLIQHKAVEPRVLADKLKEGVVGGRQLPFRYLSAYLALQKEGIDNPIIRDAIEESMVLSLGELPKLKGRVIVLSDNSGSAQGQQISKDSDMTVSKIGNLLSIFCARMYTEGYVGIAGDNLEVRGVRKTASVFDQWEELNNISRRIGQGGESGFWHWFRGALQDPKNPEVNFDTIIIISDQQAGHGGLHASGLPTEFTTGREGGFSSSWGSIDINTLLMLYRAKINPNTSAYMIQSAGYTDAVVPDFYPNTYMIGGWSDQILRFVANTEQLKAEGLKG